MEMNDILNGLNSCSDDDCCESIPNSCSCGPSFGGTGGFPGGCGFGPGIGGCGFSGWIWILLILFYCGCGRNMRGRFGNECCCERERDCCCERNERCCETGRSGAGILGNCSSFLFLLVILFLCNSGGGCGLGGFGCNNNIGCGTGC